MEISPLDQQIIALREGPEGLSFSEIAQRIGGLTKDAAQKRYRRLVGRRGARPDGSTPDDESPAGSAARRAEGGLGDGAGGLSDTDGLDRAGDPAGVIEHLRSQLREANRQLSKAKVRKEELVAAVHTAVDAAASAIVLPPVPAPVPDARRREEEVAVVLLSDWQLGKRTPSYDSATCAERIELLAEKVVRLVRIQRADHPVRRLVLHVLGDIVEGEQIFPGQAHLIDASLFEQTVETGPTILVNFIRRMLTEFDSVHVVAVIGNHGRIGRKGDFDPQTNADRMLYRVAQRILEGEPRVTWDIPSVKHERAWYAISRIGNYSALLIHGEQFGGKAGIPWPSLRAKVGGWALGAVEGHFNEVHFGHYHTPMTTVINRVIVRCNGSTESHNSYAQEKLASIGQPSQELLFVHPERGRVTASYTVWLDGGQA